MGFLAANSKRLKQVSIEYRQRGMVKHGELLLEPNDALELISELARLDVLLIGCDCWCYVDKGKSDAWEVPGGGYSVEEDVPFLEITASVSAELIRKFIQEPHLLRYQFDLIALSFNEPREGELFYG